MYTPQEHIAIDDAEKLMVETMAKYDPSHDAYHVQRVRKTALAIAHAIPQNVDFLVVELAALLHDVLDKKYVPAELAADPYAFFLPLFEGIIAKGGIDLITDGRARDITQVIDNVSWSNETKLRAQGKWTKWHDECLELHCVQDADRLDAIGAFGVMRCAAYNASKNNALHAPPGDVGVEDSAIQHFHDKLVYVHTRLKTEPGKVLGKKRHQLIVDFISATEDEFHAIIPATKAVPAAA